MVLRLSSVFKLIILIDLWEVKMLSPSACCESMQVITCQ
jgi:hypothetical protein